MAQTIHYHYKREEWEYSKTILDQGKTDTQQGKLQILWSVSAVNGLSWLFPSRVADCITCLSLLVWLHSSGNTVSTEPVSPVILASPKPWGLQHNPGFIFITSCMAWLLWDFTKGFPCHTPGLRGFS